MKEFFGLLKNIKRSLWILIHRNGFNPHNYCCTESTLISMNFPRNRRHDHYTDQWKLGWWLVAKSKRRSIDRIKNIIIIIHPCLNFPVKPVWFNRGFTSSSFSLAGFVIYLYLSPTVSISDDSVGQAVIFVASQSYSFLKQYCHCLSLIRWDSFKRGSFAWNYHLLG